MKPSKILVMAFLCLVLNTYGQQIKPLSIGDTIPDITLNNILQYKENSVKLSDFKGKPVIIDFFATWCSSCIAAFPHLDSLQKRFGDSIQILIVTYEPTNKLKSFLNTNKKAQEVNLVFIAEDTILKSLFPHKLIPHEIVLKNRQVKAITYPEYLTEETMTKLICDAPLDIPVKKDLLKFDSEKTLEENGSIENQIIFHSMLTHYLEGFGSRSRLSTANHKKKLTIINTSIIALYLRATNNYQKYDHRNRIILEVKDTSKYIIPRKIAIKNLKHDWMTENCYSYELTAPDSTSDRKMKDIMLQDLNKYFSLNGRIEKRRIKCLKLVFSSMKDKKSIKSKGGLPILKLSSSDFPKIIQNNPVSKLIAALNKQNILESLRPIIIDGTDCNHNVDLKLNIKDIQNLASITKALAPYGLELKPTEVYLDMLIISEKND